MRKLLIAVAAATSLLAALAPIGAQADTHANCNSVPSGEWAKCVIDQASDQSAQ